MLERRRELVGRLTELREMAEQCLAKVRHVEATIIMLAPGFEMDGEEAGGIVPYAAVFRYGDISPTVQKVLRQAKCPVCTVEIIDVILEERGHPRLSREDRKRLSRAVFAVLKWFLQRGDVARRGRLRKHAKGAAGSMSWVWTGEGLDARRRYSGKGCE
ncbi:hypothetical protein [Azospirillum soli]|uniref:hypothetical protein n=1 Tax=Azospirillum soli TaxID=1304799 RepID=UPI001AEB73DE|nr:hypothetical protein [Azospirillum soli]MBP2311504.1 hypothetical protein [Azospirillum soli]